MAIIARQLRTALAARFGDQCVFMDETAIKPGQDWPREIPEAELEAAAGQMVQGG